MMSELNYISIDYKKNYAIVRYETNGDCWTEELLLEIKVAIGKKQSQDIHNFEIVYLHKLPKPPPTKIKIQVIIFFD